MARFEGLAGEPEYVSGGPRERFSSPRWSLVRVVVLGLLVVAVGAYGGYRWGVAHGRHAAVNASEVVLPVGGFPSGEVFGDGSVWVTVFASDAGSSPTDSANHKPGWVARYDPVTLQVQRIPVGSGPIGMGEGFGSMWVSNAGDASVTRIDEADNKVLATIKVGPFPYQAAPAGGGMWVATQRAAVKIDPATNTVVARVPYRRPPHTEMASTAGVAMDADAHGVWVSTAYGTVLRLRPSDGHLLKTIRVQPVPDSQPGSVVVDGNDVWVSNYPVNGTAGPGAGSDYFGPHNHLTEINATTGRIVKRVPTAGYPVLSFLPEANGTVLMLGWDGLNKTSELIRTDWPYQVDAYVRPLRSSSCFGLVDTHEHIWIPCFETRSLHILPDSVGLL